MFWWLQIKGLVAGVLIASVGMGLLAGFRVQKNWFNRVCWLVIVGFFCIPLIAVAVSIWYSRFR